MEEKQEEQDQNRACPCLYLDEPCKGEWCTCKNPLSSHGCDNCCTYGSIEQRKRKAKVLAQHIRDGRERLLQQMVSDAEEMGLYDDYYPKEKKDE